MTDEKLVSGILKFKIEVRQIWKAAGPVCEVRNCLLEQVRDRDLHRAAVLRGLGGVAGIRVDRFQSLIFVPSRVLRRGSYCGCRCSAMKSTKALSFGVIWRLARAHGIDRSR